MVASGADVETVLSRCIAAIGKLWESSELILCVRLHLQERTIPAIQRKSRLKRFFHGNQLFMP